MRSSATGSSEPSAASLVVVALVGNVGLGVGAWNTWCGTPVLLGLSVLRSSKKEGVGTYFYFLIRIAEENRRYYQ